VKPFSVRDCVRAKDRAVRRFRDDEPLLPVPARAQCVGARPVVAAMKAGTNLNIGMESVTRKPVTIPVSLAGFTVAIDKLEAIR